MLGDPDKPTEPPKMLGEPNRTIPTNTRSPPTPLQPQTSVRNHARTPNKCSVIKRPRTVTPDGGSAEAPALMYMYRCLFVCSFLWSEKTAKKEACVLGVLVVGGGQPKRMLRASGQTYVRQVLPPTFHSFELVAVSHCFSRHHV